MSSTIPTGEIPNSQCPKCGAPLYVRNKRRQTVTNKHNQFVGCSMFFITGCAYVTTVSEEVATVMIERAAEFAALPAEF